MFFSTKEVRGRTVSSVYPEVILIIFNEDSGLRAN